MIEILLHASLDFIHLTTTILAYYSWYSSLPSSIQGMQPKVFTKEKFMNSSPHRVLQHIRLPNRSSCCMSFLVIGMCSFICVAILFSFSWIFHLRFGLQKICSVDQKSSLPVVRAYFSEAPLLQQNLSTRRKNTHAIWIVLMKTFCTQRALNIMQIWALSRNHIPFL